MHTRALMRSRSLTAEEKVKTVPKCLTLVSLSGQVTYTAVFPMSMCWIPRKCWEEIIVVITLSLRRRLLEVDVGQTQNTWEELFVCMTSALGMLVEGWGAAGGGRKEEVRDYPAPTATWNQMGSTNQFSSATQKSFLFMTCFLLNLWGWCRC